MDKIKLIVSRHYSPMEFDFSTIKEAAQEAMRQLDAGDSWPNKIVKDGAIVWEHDGPFGPALNELEELAGTDAIPS